MATELKNFKATGISTLTIEDFSERTKPPDAEKKNEILEEIWITSVEHAEWINKTREKMRAKDFFQIV